MSTAAFQPPFATSATGGTGTSEPARRSEPPAPERLADRLRGVRVGVRDDLEVSRHVFRGAPSYVVRDPLTFQSQRLDLCDYDILIRIRADHALGDCFDDLVASGQLRHEDEERFYLFVLSLHRIGFLRLPIADDKLLFRRYQMRLQARRREKVFGFLFLRIPLWNPDAFLNRTMHLVRPLFTRTAFVLWLMLMAAAATVVVRRWEDLVNPLQGVLTAGNLPLIWVTLIGLKVFHEFGHSYACKHYGGHVPEMGAYLIVFTPCAYMDATASWGFSRKIERIIVCLAGMYVELAIAAVAVFVWAATGPSLINALAFNVIFLASAVTVLFNINPLMRYDGYYIASDLTEIPNLRQRSRDYVLGVFKRLLFGITTPDLTASRPGETPDGDEAKSRRKLARTLGIFGVAAGLYRVFLLVAIAALLATRLLFVGLLLGIFLLGGLLSSVVFKLTKYLWYAEEIAGHRRRAVALSMLLLIVVPAGLMWIPVPSSVRAAAVLGRADEVIVRPPVAGFIANVAVAPGTQVRAGDPLVQLENDVYAEELAQIQARLAAATIRRDAFRTVDPTRALQEDAAVRAFTVGVMERKTRLAALDVRAADDGEVVQCLRQYDIGRFFPEGSPLAMIVSGSWQVRTVLSADQLALARLEPGDAVTFRPAGRPGEELHGKVVRVAPQGSRRIADPSLTHLGGGDVAVNPESGEASEPYFEITLELTDAGDVPLRHGMSGAVLMDAGPEPIGVILARRVLRFWNRLRPWS